MIKTRFAPSPTGFLHIGGLRTALFAYLFARQNNGKFLLRIEDTDRERLVDGAVENILEALEWAGFSPDEGVVKKGAEVTEIGENGPYTQSERLELYQEYIKKLLDSGDAYYCFCTKERLEELRKIQELNKQATGYDGHCRDLGQDEVKSKLESNESHVARLRVPREGETVFTDLVRGEMKFENKLIDDQVLMKADGFPTYHFAVVVDDHLMEITHVIRGEEWLPSTPKHIILYKAFGWEAPIHAHLPLMVNEKKQKLSKRHGDVSVEDFRKKGYLPETMVNFIAFLGWNPGDEREIFTLSELEKEFTFDKVGKAAAVFNREKLDWYNKQYMMKMEIGELTDRALPFFNNAGILNISEEYDRVWLGKVVELERGRANNLVELVEATGFVFAESLVYEPELLVWKKSTKEGSREMLEKASEVLNTISVQNWNKEKIEEIMMAWIKENEYGVGDVLWPMRVALSGQKNSPGPFEIADVLGKEKCLERIGVGVGKL